MDITALNDLDETALCYAVMKKNVQCTLTFLCFGAPIDEMAIRSDKTGLLSPINDRLNLLRHGNRIGSTLMSEEEKRLLWNLAFFFTIQHGGAVAFKAFYAIRSFVTFNGIFMAPGYDLGVGSIWRKT